MAERSIEIVFKQEMDIDLALMKRVSSLLQRGFGKDLFEGRSYLKQLPYGRFLAIKNGKVIGHLGVDYRVMNLDKVPVTILGGIDLCVDTRYRGRGIAKSIMSEFEKRAKANKGSVDFLFLVTDIPKFYSDLGFKPTKPVVLWHRLHRHQSFGVAIEQVKDNTLMFKKIGNKKWTGKMLDMLGYWY